MLSIIGIISVPEFVAAIPVTPCRKSGTIVIAPNIPAPTRNVTSADTTNVRSRNSESGRLGSLASRSATMKSASITAEEPNSCTISRERHGYWLPPRASASSNGTSTALMSTTPITSTFGRCPASGRTHGMPQRMMRNAATATGRFR